MYGYYEPYWPAGELEHYGVLGMKWGIRRYQNPDGSLTDIGKKRYGNVESFQDDVSKRYNKAASKLQRLDTKVTRQNMKGARREQKAVKKQRKASSALLFQKHKAKVASKATREALKAYQKAQETEIKAYRWNEKMRKKFEGINYSSMNQRYVSLGEKYSKNSIDNIMKNNISVNSIMNIDEYYRNMSRR